MNKQKERNNINDYINIKTQIHLLGIGCRNCNIGGTFDLLLHSDKKA